MKRFTGDVWVVVAGPVLGFVIVPLFAAFAVGCGCSTAAAAEQGKPATPMEQYQALLKEFQTAASSYYPSTNDAERRNIVARADKTTVRLLELVENNPTEPFALEALTQIVTQEYW